MTGAENLRVRAWCLTQHYEFPDVLKEYEDILRNLKGVVYLIVGRETCPTTGRKHLQIYIHFKNAREFSTIKKKFPTAHIEPAKGTAEQNQDYCSKEGDCWEVGTPPKQGKRNDMENIKEKLHQGCRMRDIVPIATSIQSVRMAEIHLKYFEEKRSERPIVKWYWGPTGCGKTYQAKIDTGFMENPDDVFWALDTIKWWEGYDAHPNVILEDIRGDFAKFHQMLKLFDENPYQVECKGGSRQFRAKLIIITAPYPPEQLFPTIEDNSQLLDRLEEIREFRGKSKRTPPRRTVQEN